MRGAEGATPRLVDEQLDGGSGQLPHAGTVGDQVRDLEAESFADLMVDVNLAEIDRDLDELRLFDAAMVRMGDGRYGVCEECALPIEIERLDATPFASRCFDCQSTYERTHYQKTGRTL